MNYKLAILITCHNRKHKTLSCLESIDKLDAPKEVNKTEIFLVDDGSIDGTSGFILPRDILVIHM